MTPVYFKLPQSIKDDVGKWLKENSLLESISYDWIKGMLAFEDNRDAVAFSLKFAIYPIETTLDKMIKDEESIN
jgi:hypothetical protein